MKKQLTTLALLITVMFSAFAQDYQTPAGSTTTASSIGNSSVVQGIDLGRIRNELLSLQSKNLQQDSEILTIDREISDRRIDLPSLISRLTKELNDAVVAADLQSVALSYVPNVTTTAQQNTTAINTVLSSTAIQDINAKIEQAKANLEAANADYEIAVQASNTAATAANVAYENWLASEVLMCKKYYGRSSTDGTCNAAPLCTAN